MRASCPYLFWFYRFFRSCPYLWNSLPLDIRNSCSIASFRRQLKTFLFSTSGHLYSALPHPSASDSASFSRTVLCALQIYLLTYLLTQKLLPRLYFLCSRLQPSVSDRLSRSAECRMIQIYQIRDVCICECHVSAM